MLTSCLPDDFNPLNSSAIIPVNATCIIRAMNSQTQELEDKQQYYFMYLLWGTFGLSAVRFIGVSQGEDQADDLVLVLLGGETAWTML